MAKLNCHVLVHDGHGNSVVLGPTDDVPEWAVTAITNPEVWAEPPAPVPDPRAPGRVRATTKN